MARRAPLLPVFTIRREDGRFVTIVEPPLPVSDDRGANGLAVEALARRLEHHVAQVPDQLLWLHPAILAPVT